MVDIKDIYNWNLYVPVPKGMTILQQEAWQEARRNEHANHGFFHEKIIFNAIVEHIYPEYIYATANYYGERTHKTLKGLVPDLGVNIYLSLYCIFYYDKIIFQEDLFKIYAGELFEFEGEIIRIEGERGHGSEDIQNTIKMEFNLQSLKKVDPHEQYADILGVNIAEKKVEMQHRSDVWIQKESSRIANKKALNYGITGLVIGIILSIGREGFLVRIMIFTIISAIIGYLIGKGKKINID